MDGRILSTGQTGSRANEAGFHLSYQIRDEHRLVFSLCRSSVSSQTRPCMTLGLWRPQQPSPLCNPEQPVQSFGTSSRLDAMLQLPAGHRKAFADGCSLAAHSIPGRGHHITGQECVPRTLVLLRGRVASSEELL